MEGIQLGSISETIGILIGALLLFQLLKRGVLVVPEGELWILERFGKFA